MTVHISKGNHKVGHIANISLTPIKSCGNCSKCKHDCYALKSYRMYPKTRQAWDENLALAIADRRNYFQQVDAWLTKHTPPAFRWHVSGDILDQDYLEGMKDIALVHPDVKFLAFTKMYDLDYSGLPENLSIVLSAWPGLPLRNHFNLPVAFMQDGTEDRVENAVECFGNCETCGMCWSLKEIHKNVFFKKH